MKRLLTFPSTAFCQKLEIREQAFTDTLLVFGLVPTLAAINGHCFAGGMMLALCCDYRVMTDGERRNTWMCMNEVRAPATLARPGIAPMS
jgi:enoyl-CoA hydratase/carnithine racemase